MQLLVKHRLVEGKINLGQRANTEGRALDLHGTNLVPS